MFPGNGQAHAARPTLAAPSVSGTTSVNRIGSIDEWLNRAPAPAPVQQAQPVPPSSPKPAAQVAVAAKTPVPAPAASKPKVWLQLASGKNAQALPAQFQRIRSRTGDLLDGISGYVAEEPDRARLLIGPFRNKADADLFAENLDAEQVSAFSWTNPVGQAVRKLPAE
jgi:cell division septation protein DedD